MKLVSAGNDGAYEYTRNSFIIAIGYNSGRLAGTAAAVDKRC